MKDDALEVNNNNTGMNKNNDNAINHLLRSYSVLGTVLSAVHALFL